MTDEFVARSKKWLENRDKSKPFFLYYAAQNIHAPRTPNPRFKGKSGLGYRGDSMVEFDWAVGELIKTLDEQGLTENTLVIFSSDNGPVYDDGYEDETTVPTSTKEVDREMNNLIAKQPDRAATMKERLIHIRDAKAGIRSLK
ncbi:MAG: sulfatase-like hydrolase/transferase [Verrucomicrobiota bacterium]